MICLFLCAGYATRMYPLTENFPKPLLEINGKTILDFLMDDLESKHYISKYIVVSNHKFFHHFLKWKTKRKENILVLDDGSTKNENRLGAVKDIAFAIKEEKIEEDLLVLAGDNLVTFSLNEFIEFSNLIQKSCVMTYEEYDTQRLMRTGVISVNAFHQVTSFEEKPKNPKSHFAVPPFYIFRKKDLSFIHQGISNGCQVDSPGMLFEWLVKNIDIYAWKMTGTRMDIGNLEDYYRIIEKSGV